METLETAIATLNARLSWLPPAVVSLILFALSISLFWWLHKLAFRVLDHAVREQSLFRRSIVQRLAKPARLAFIMGGIAFAAAIAPLSAGQTQAVQHTMLFCFILLAGGIAITVLNIWMTLYLRRFKLDAEDNLLARKHVTQSRILQRVAETLIVLVTLSVAMMTFDSVRQYGVSLLASAGAAGLVLGLALQPVLKNLIAGIQLAITQPIRIDDALLVENEWGKVEEITSTYVVVRLWDLRRLIVPLAYFIEKPFQNWTREGAALIGSVFLYVDFTVPVKELRAKLEEIARGSALWDGNVVNLQVTDFKENTMEIRMLVSASNSGNAFDLRCEVREKMIAFLQEKHPQALPRLRTDLGAPSGREPVAPVFAS
ncbi:MAG: mechanosensitive ion channel [Methylobacterium mesophilicum]|nr:mechanosensitive ion channel [Methylobacterium mesophilicum]